MQPLVIPFRYDWHGQFEHLYLQWKTDKEDTEPVFRIENASFQHDPQWNTRFFSIQSAHDGGHWVWRATRIAFALSGGVV